MLSPELQSKMLIWRQKSKEGTITIDEMKEAIIALRESRKTAAETSSSPRAKSKSPPSDKKVEDMLSELEGL
jgi:hypothetical protein